MRRSIAEFTQPTADVCRPACWAITNAVRVRPSVEVGVPYQAGTEAATAVVKGDGPQPPQPPPWPLGPLDNMWMAHLLPSAKTSVGESNTFSRDTLRKSNG